MADTSHGVALRKLKKKPTKMKQMVPVAQMALRAQAARRNNKESKGSLTNLALKAVDKAIQKKVQHHANKYEEQTGNSARQWHEEVAAYDIRKSLKNKMPRDLYEKVKTATYTNVFKDNKKHYQNLREGRKNILHYK